MVDPLPWGTATTTGTKGDVRDSTVALRCWLHKTHFFMRPRTWRRFGIILFLLLAIVLSACVGEGSFKPGRPSPTPQGIISGEAIPVTFAELDADPWAYQGRLIRVSGMHVTLPAPACTRYRGPQLEWALVGENFRLDVAGFESVMQWVPEEMALTVDGFLRLYQGPLGCGKEPPAGTVWYLDMVRLVQPNPLPGLGIVEDREPSPRVTPPAAGVVTPTAAATEATAIPTGTSTPTPTPGASPSLSPTPTEGTPGAATPSSTPTPAAETGTPSATPTLTATPAGTSSSGDTPTPAPPTNTPPPDSYPGGTSPPAATSPPNGYP